MESPRHPTRAPPWRWSRPGGALLLVVLALAAPARADPTLELDGLLERARDAHRPDVVTVPLVVRGRHGTAAGWTDYALHFDRDGRFFERGLDPQGTTRGFDGETAWVDQPWGVAHAVSLGERDRLLLTIWLVTGQWVEQGEHFAWGQPRRRRGLVELPFALCDGDASGTLALDAASGRLQSARWLSGGRSLHVTLVDSGMDGPVHLPARVSIVDEDMVRELRLESVEPMSERPDVFTLASRSRPALAFDAERDVALPLRFAAGLPLVRPRLDGQDVGWFLLDTGAGVLALHTRALERLEVAAVGRSRLAGVGGSAQAGLVRAGSLALGPVTLSEPVAAVYDLSALERGLDTELAGIVGYELLARCVADLDLGAGTLRLLDPDRPPEDDLPWQPLALYENAPLVQASYEGHAGWFLLDTGANSAVVLHPRAVATRQLLHGRDTRAARSSGVGGRVPTRRGTLAALEVGGLRFEDVQATFVTEARGVLSDASLDGVLGVPLLRHFRIVLDYPGGRLALVPGSAPGR